ncbi:MAG: hypothetical protein A3H96_11260 [Acidobacteria bacterium RIFCSPLOWO2_02_FULL_67_36]|nr:MAG: hypothetical protein A3H96_11260 [Acidobacteria bacterium RIFCSPLOWO2_02_FULL_67_36]OFW23976.1 MAG: hypothetical protein A3G21_03630 [Acidobacteria bacterium RIFCSPLOWO2_12_FULL_66_21]
MGHREAKIIAAVACPTCGARVGQPCDLPQRGRPVVHPARKQAWQATRRPPDYVIQPRAEGPAGARTHYMLVAPQHQAAIDHLRSLMPPTGYGWTWVAGALRVPAADMPVLVQSLVAAGWTTGEEAV